VVETLTASGLHFAYPGPLVAVQGVDVELRAGEMVCVLGPNGAGKSTLLKLLAGLLPTQSGDVALDGDELSALSARERAARVAVVPQSLDAVPEVTVFDFVLSGRYSHLGFWRTHKPNDYASVHAALAATDCAELDARLLTNLSGGQRQRVLIARALAQEAELLLVDEPTNSLDPEHQLAIFELLRRLTDEGRSVLVVTHDLNLASQFAHRLLLMQDGRVVASGSPADVLHPDVLGPVYGEHLQFGSLPATGERGERPFVIPWMG